jgi:hypothetical protein
MQILGLGLVWVYDLGPKVGFWRCLVMLAEVDEWFADGVEVFIEGCYGE